MSEVAAASDDPVTVTLEEGRLLVRVHRNDRSAIFFGPAPPDPPANRFDAPAGEYRILYAAERLEGAFVETILRRARGRVLRREFVNERGWSSLRLERPVVLAKLYDEGLQAYKVDAGELGANNYAFSRALAVSIFKGFPDIQGLAYRSRYNNGEICYALFDRVTASDLKPLRHEKLEAIPERVDQLMKLHRAVFDTSPRVPDNPPKA